MLEIKSQLMNKDSMDRTIIRISHEIIERNTGADNLVILGILTRGVPLANKIVSNIKNIEHKDVPLGIIDITNNRDDYSIEQKRKLAKESTIPDIVNKTVILVDDVIYTGRSIKAALEVLFTRGRPKAVQVVALIDRGHRELPIRADYVGKNIPTSRNEVIKVKFKELDNDDGVYILG